MLAALILSMTVALEDRPLYTSMQNNEFAQAFEDNRPDLNLGYSSLVLDLSKFSTLKGLDKPLFVMPKRVPSGDYRDLIWKLAFSGSYGVGIGKNGISFKSNYKF